MDYPITVWYTIMVYTIYIYEVGDSIIAIVAQLLGSKQLFQFGLLLTFTWSVITRVVELNKYNVTLMCWYNCLIMEANKYPLNGLDIWQWISDMEWFHGTVITN